MAATLTKEQMDFLRSMDTPTVCNVVEMVAPERRGHGYTVKHLFCPFPDLPPIVGFARTVTAKANSSGDADVWASASARGVASSSGDVTVHGQPASFDKETSSSGSVRKL